MENAANTATPAIVTASNRRHGFFTARFYHAGQLTRPCRYEYRQPWVTREARRDPRLSGRDSERACAGTGGNGSAQWRKQYETPRRTRAPTTAPPPPHLRHP